MDKISELKNCTPIKGILMLIIVLYHSMIIFAADTWGPCTRAVDAPILGLIANWMNSFHIYAFTLISGYIFYYIKYEKHSYQKYVPFLANKAQRLLVPYVFIAAVWVAPINKILLPNENIISMFVLGTAPRQLWFLLMLFWVFAIFWFISDIANRHPILGAVIVCALYIGKTFAPSYFCIYRGLEHILYFYAGFLIRKYAINKQLYKIPSIVYFVVDIALFVSTKILANQSGILFKMINIVLIMGLHLFGAIAAFILLQRFVNRFLQDNKIIEFFSKHSMVIYLVHQQLIYFSIGWFNDVVPPIILVLTNFAFSLTVSTAFAVLMSKTKVTRFLVGSK